MKNKATKLKNALLSIAEKQAERSVNCTSSVVLFQPKIPAALKRLSKINNGK